MKINYEEIISKANDRAEALREIARRLDDVEAEADSLVGALNYFATTYTMIKALDKEGQDLLPSGVANRLVAVGYLAKHMLDKLRSGNQEDIRKMLEALEANR